MTLAIADHGAVRVVTLDRPDVANALDGATITALTTLWQQGIGPEVRCVVLTGAGKAFCAGADLKAAARADGGMRGLREGFNPMVLAAGALDVPVIAAVNGAAAGAGLSLACAADLRIASTAAKFVPSFSTIGLVPDAGATYYVPRLVGPSRAFRWLAGGAPWSAEEAAVYGLVDEVVAPEALMARALEVAHEIAARPGEAARLTKRALTAAGRRHLAEQLELEAELQQRALVAPGRAEARAAMVGRMGTASTRDDGEGTTP